MPGSVSNQTRSLVEMVAAMAFVRGAMRVTMTSWWRSVLRNFAQSIFRSVRRITLTVSTPELSSC